MPQRSFQQRQEPEQHAMFDEIGGVNWMSYQGTKPKVLEEKERSDTSGSGSSNSTSGLIEMPEGFRPGPWDVICARGKFAKEHSGNQRFREKIKEVTPAYSKAETKLQKSIVVSSVINHVRNSPTGGEGFFVKEVDDVWYDVGDTLAREKVGQALRDQLHSHYRSSTKSKRRRWRQEEQERSRLKKQAKSAQRATFVDKLVYKNQEVWQRADQIMEQSRVQAAGVAHATDEFVMGMFTRNNLSLLQAFKQEPNLEHGNQQEGANSFEPFAY
eukprot:scaffold14515_cov97-Cylindrotheca_fusiformis.AAC.2